MLRSRAAVAERLTRLAQAPHASIAVNIPVQPVLASTPRHFTTVATSAIGSTAIRASTASSSFSCPQCRCQQHVGIAPSPVAASSLLLRPSSSSTPARGFGSQAHSKTLEFKRAKTAKAHLAKLGFNPLNYKVAILGRPNVGKSTLFNRLVGRAAALVDNKPGVTRDRREGDGTLGELEFAVVDTAGLEEVQEFLLPRNEGRAPSAAAVAAELGEYRLLNQQPMDRALQRSIMAQTELAIAEADVVLFMLDAREGVTPLDRSFAQWLRRQSHKTIRVEHPDSGRVTHERQRKPVVLLANKCDSSEQEMQYIGLTEGWELGFGEPVALSADHAGGMSGLHNALHAALTEVFPAKQAAFARREEELNHEVDLLPSMRHIKLAVVGKVNTGKSTLVNTLLGRERVLTGAQPGVTRDAVELEWRDTEEEEREQERERKIRQKEIDRQQEELKQTTTGKQRREMREAAAAAAAAVAATTSTSESHDGAPSSAATDALVPSSGLVVPAASAPLPSYRFTLVDTAGLKGVTSHSHSKYSRVDAAAMGASLRAIERANVVALVVDISEAGIEGVEGASSSTSKKAKKKLEAKAAVEHDPATASGTALHSMLFKPGRRYTEEERGMLLRTFARNLLTSNDLSIASKALREGRALMILLNKFDLVPASSPQLRQQILEGLQAQMQNLLPDAGGTVPVLAVSGMQSFDPLRGQMLKTTLRSSIIDLFNRWSARVPTHALNRWLQELMRFHPAPPVRMPGGEMKKTSLKFIQQVSTGPPAFVLFSNTPAASLPDHFQSFLLGSLRRQFDLQGVPVRLMLRVRKNPYLDPATKQRARERARADANELEEAVPAFAEHGKDSELAADADEDGGEFDEADYAASEDIIRFDYDVDDAATKGNADTAEAQIEMQREREVAAAAAQRRAAAQQEQARPAAAPAAAAASGATPSSRPAARPAVMHDSPIPRVSGPPSIPRAQPRPLKVNTSNVFASQRTVASKPGRNLGINASSKWSLGRSRLGDHGAFGPGQTLAKKHDKPFGTRRSKKPSGGGAAGGGMVQSANVVRTTSKVNEWEAKRKEQAKNARMVAKRRKQTQRDD